MTLTIPTESVEDVLARLSLPEKVGLLFHPMVMLGDVVDLEARPPWGGPTLRELIVDRGIRFFCLGSTPSPQRSAAVLGELQQLARQSGSGLPIVFSSDPRHSFAQTEGASHAADGVSQWPEPIGLAAINDPALVRTFGDTVRSDYIAMGIRMALHPQVDLATEPRWARQAQGFGADSGLTSRLTVEYLKGLQGGDSLSTGGVAATTKHFPGGGAQLNGEDPHFPYGREQVYPGGRLEDHLEPFRAAIAAGTAVIMPYYGMPVGLTLDGEPVEAVGFGYNRQIITGLLRDKLGYTGVVLSDFGLVHDQVIFGKPFPARAWGVEHLTARERVGRLIHAGVDQLGGENCTALVLELVENGDVDEARLDESVRRILTLQLALGEPAEINPIGAAEEISLGRTAQARSVTVLSDRDALLPLRGERRVLLHGLASDALPAGWVAVDTAEEADLAVVRLGSPFEPRDTYFLESGMHQGSLDLLPADVERISSLAATLPVVLAVTLTRPAILTAVADVVAVLVADYGADDTALVAALTGEVVPAGRLPFELPRSMAAVIASHPDVASDTENPLFPIGWGIG